VLTTFQREAMPTMSATARGPGWTAVLEVVQLNLWFQSRQVLHDVNLALPARGAMALIGPAGAGKSSLLTCLNRMADDAAGVRRTGQIRFRGRDLDAAGTDLRHIRQRIGLVSQKATPFPASIFENVAFGPRIAGERHLGKLGGLVEQALKQADLWLDCRDRLDDEASTLTPGQQQRLCIARTLALQPDVVLIDEPSKPLDAASANRFDDLIDDLKTRYAIAFVPHSLEQASRVSDTTAFLDGGRLIEVNRTSALFTAPAHKRTEDYITGRTE